MFLAKWYTSMQKNITTNIFFSFGTIALTLIFVFGYLFTFSRLEGYALSFFCALILILFSAGLMAWRVGPPSHATAPLWLCLAYFILFYCVKFFLILLFPASPAVMGTVGPLCLPVEFACLNTYTHSLTPYDWTTVPAEAKAITLTAICIAGFCLAASTATYSKRHNEQIPITKTEATYAKFLWILALFLSIATAALFYRYQIGLMGSVIKTDLPYRLRGIVYFIRTILLPGMLYLSIHIAYRNKSFGLMMAGVLLLLGNGGLDVVFRSSRSAMLYPLLGLFLLMLSAEVRIRLRTMLWGGVSILPVFISIPYVSAFRVNRINLDIWDSIVKTTIEIGFNPLIHLAKGLVFVFYRFTGIDVLASMLGHEALPIGGYLFEVLRSDRGVSGYLSTAIYGTPVDYPGASAPGFVGWCYLVGGLPGVLIGGAVLALVVRFLWGFLLKKDTSTFIVARVFFLMTLFLVITDGTVDTLRKMIFTMLVTLLVLELGSCINTILLNFRERRTL